jgi:predicted phosphodiesterase
LIRIRIISLISIISISLVCQVYAQSEGGQLEYQTNPKKVFISDMHPEQYDSDIWERARGFGNDPESALYIIGDSRIPPYIFTNGVNANKWIKGNHDYVIGEKLPKYILLNNKRTLLIHGHNAEEDDYWISQFLIRKRIKLSDTYTCNNADDWEGSLDYEYIERLETLYYWIKGQDRFKYVTRVIMGHHHLVYVWRINDIVFYNTGAGFRGNFIIREGGKTFLWRYSVVR